MLFTALWAPCLKMCGNHHGNCLGSGAPIFQNDGLQGSSDPPLGTSTAEGAWSKISEACKTLIQGLTKKVSS